MPKLFSAKAGARITLLIQPTQKDARLISPFGNTTKTQHMEYTHFRDTLAELSQLAEERGEHTAFRELETALAQLSELRSTLSSSDEIRHIDAFRRASHHLILQSEFNYYVFTKPRGYSGDFVTQEMIWMGRMERGDHRYRGISNTGKLLTALTFDMAASHANEARVKRLSSILQNSGFKQVASIGCGAGIEYREVNGKLPEDIFLLDQDGDALAQAKASGNFGGSSVTFCEENIIKFILRNVRCQYLGMRDLIYAFGLFDYFPLKTAKRIVALLWVSVLPGGKLLVTNAHPQNPTRLWMEWGGEWYLDYKTEDQMHAIVDGLDGVVDVSYDIDEFGVYQYLTIQKDS